MGKHYEGWRAVSARQKGRAALALLSTVLLGGLPVTAAGDEKSPAAQEQAIDFAIPAQPLHTALNRLAEMGGLQFAYSAEQLKGVQSPGVGGRYTVEEALKKLLQGTGMNYRFTGNRTVTLEKTPAVWPDDDATLRKVTVTARKGDDPKSYKVTNASAATKTDTPIMETPASIQVVPYQVMQDQKSYRVQDALENVSGVQPRGSLGGYRERYIIRGFRGNENFYRNGLRVASFSLLSNFQTFKPLILIESMCSKGELPCFTDAANPAVR